VTKEISRLGHYCGVNGVKPSDLTEEMIKRICSGEFDPPCIKGCVKTSTMTYQEWDKLIAKANKIDDLRFLNKPSSPTKDAHFNWIKNVSGIGLIVCGFILGWLAHGQ